MSQVAGAALSCKGNADVPEKIKTKIANAEKTLDGLVAEARKYEEEKQAPKGRPKHLATEAKQAVEEGDKICKLVDDLIEE